MRSRLLSSVCLLASSSLNSIVGAWWIIRGNYLNLVILKYVSAVGLLALAKTRAFDTRCVAWFFVS